MNNGKLWYNLPAYMMKKEVRMKKNILITGRRNSGKTTLLWEVIKEYDLAVCGYQTLARRQYDCGWTYVMSDLISKKQACISACVNGQIQGLEKTFAGFGVKCLKDALKCEKQVVLLDELGRFEKNCHEFINCVLDLLDSQKIIFAVLKKEPIPYLEQIQKRQDVILFDLDKQDYHEIKQQLVSYLQLIIGGKM